MGKTQRGESNVTVRITKTNARTVRAVLSAVLYAALYAGLSGCPAKMSFWSASFSMCFTWFFWGYYTQCGRGSLWHSFFARDNMKMIRSCYENATKLLRK